MSFPARYPARCPDCHFRIEEGEQVEYRPVRTGVLALVHVDCESADLQPVIVGKQCPRCHLTMSITGVCDNCN